MFFSHTYCTHTFTPGLHFSPLYYSYKLFQWSLVFPIFSTLHFTSFHFTTLLDDFHFTLLRFSKPRSVAGSGRRLENCRWSHNFDCLWLHVSKQAVESLVSTQTLHVVDQHTYFASGYNKFWRNAYKISVEMHDRALLGNVGVFGSVILKWILRK